jgi:AP endonuclease-2
VQVVKKKDTANRGRTFYVCARPEGPRSDPAASCNHFQWADRQPTRDPKPP